MQVFGVSLLVVNSEMGINSDNKSFTSNDIRHLTSQVEGVSETRLLALLGCQGFDLEINELLSMRNCLTGFKLKL